MSDKETKKEMEEKEAQAIEVIFTAYAKMQTQQLNDLTVITNSNYQIMTLKEKVLKGLNLLNEHKIKEA